MNTTSNLSTGAPPQDTLDAERSPRWLTVSVLAVSGITILINIPAATFVIYAKHKFPQFRCIHLLSLSFTDILVGISLVPILWTYVFPDDKITYWGCNGIFLFFAFAHCNSKTQVAVICFDRLLLLIRPDWKYVGNYHRRMLTINIATLFVICGLMNVPFWLFAKPRNNDIKCKLDSLFLDDISEFCLYSGIVACVVQVFIMGDCVAMIAILQRRRRAFRQVEPLPDPDSVSSVDKEQRTERQQKEEVMRLETRGIVTIVSIAAAYSVCITPLNFGFLAQGLKIILEARRTTRHLLITFSCVNSAINPFVYCFRVAHVRRAMTILLRKI
ncbi:beta-2 adrenergic receptor-like [Pecten maximus]|uniref:beta-2 adrenergic receptor-like n=1 Tax=Pecten maximus TaxID=6579 RepID=UPI0014588AC6|nr:beta-2 adrenergic receptor-like [Pecten maximus]